MSHFTVLIAGDDVEGQLAPYDENTRVAPYKDYIDLKSSWPMSDVKEKRPDLVVEEWDVDAYRAVADFLNKEWGDEYTEYGHDDVGVFQWSTYNQSSKWDYWRPGGRWAGSLKLKTGAQGELEPLSWEWEPQFNNDEPLPDFTGKADSALKGDVDIDGMRSDAVQRANDDYDRFEAIVAEHGPLPSADWRDLAGERREDFEAGREAYWEHPTVKALRDAGLVGFMEFPNDIFGMPREEFVERARLAAVPGYAFVYKGRWYEPGRMGWWGMSSDDNDSRLKYHREVNQIIDSLPDDILLTMVDCHI